MSVRSKSRGHQKTGSHGSLSKAGKVRDHFQYEVVDRNKEKRLYGLVTKKKNPIKHNRRHANPRIANKKKYYKRFILPKLLSRLGIRSGKRWKR